MNKNRIRTYVVLAIILAVFLLVALAIPFERGPVFTMSLVFGIVAILVQIYTFQKGFFNSERILSKLYGFAVVRVGVIYLVVQLIASIAFMAIGSRVKTWIPLIIFAVLFALCAIGVISAEVSKETAEKVDVKTKASIAVIKLLRARAESMAQTCTRAELKQALSSLAEEFKYSDPVSSEATSAAESELTKLLDELSSKLADADEEQIKQVCSQISNKLKERNLLCRMIK